MTDKSEETVKVMVRVRPMNKTEKQKGNSTTYTNRMQKHYQHGLSNEISSYSFGRRGS